MLPDDVDDTKEQNIKNKREDVSTAQQRKIKRLLLPFLAAVYHTFHAQAYLELQNQCNEIVVFPLLCFCSVRLLPMNKAGIFGKGSLWSCKRGTLVRGAFAQFRKRSKIVSLILKP